MAFRDAVFPDVSGHAPFVSGVNVRAEYGGAPGDARAGARAGADSKHLHIDGLELPSLRCTSDAGGPLELGGAAWFLRGPDFAHVPMLGRSVRFTAYLAVASLVAGRLLGGARAVIAARLAAVEFSQDLGRVHPGAPQPGAPMAMVYRFDDVSHYAFWTRAVDDTGDEVEQVYWDRETCTCRIGGRAVAWS